MTPGTRRTRAVDELASVVRPLGRVVVARLPEIVAGVAVLVTALAVLALVGAVLDDRAIAANPVVTEAEVLDGSSFTRTLVSFTVDSGEIMVPERGVFYPRGLQAGQSITVEYEANHPELVRVAGRSALDGLLPLSLGVLVTWAVLVPLAVWLRRRRRTP